MITIGYSTRKSSDEFKELIRKSSGLPKIEIVEKVNSEGRSLTEVYNEILNEASNDIVVLCHDDIYFDTKNWANKILKHFNKSEYGILGVAGTISMPKSGMWWEDRTTMIGIVNHENGGKKWESKYSKNLEDKVKNVIIVDGLFLCVHKKRIQTNFNESVIGFHFYDVNFCFENFIKGVKIGVIFDVRITHKSIGMTNEKWEENRLLFSKKFSDYLPKKITKNSEELLTVLVSVENELILQSDLISRLTELPENWEIHIVSNLKKIKLKNKNIKLIEKNQIPKTKIGDGRWSLTINGNTIPSVDKVLYNTNGSFYDMIIHDNNKEFNYIKTAYPNLIKLKLSNNLNLVNSTEILNHLNSDLKKNIKIKILSNYSSYGGSTVAFINLTNELNNCGYDCTFYGPHNYHLDKCKSDLIMNLNLEETDRLICHFINLPERPNVHKVIFACHEKWWWSFKNINNFFDTCVFLHEQHKEFHQDYYGDYNIIPNLKPNLHYKEKNDKKMICGIIGSVEERKQTHVSIERAIADNCEKILIFGAVADKNYFDNQIVKYINNGLVEYIGYTENKQEMYDSIGRVYHSSKGEVACLVKDECFITGTDFFGNSETNNEVSDLTNSQIIKKWKNLLDL